MPAPLYCMQDWCETLHTTYHTVASHYVCIINSDTFDISLWKGTLDACPPVLYAGLVWNLTHHLSHSRVPLCMHNQLWYIWYLSVKGTLDSCPPVLYAGLMWNLTHHLSHSRVPLCMHNQLWYIWYLSVEGYTGCLPPCIVCRIDVKPYTPLITQWVPLWPVSIPHNSGLSLLGPSSNYSYNWETTLKHRN